MSFPKALAGIREAIASCLKGVKECRLLALGISNQRETISRVPELSGFGAAVVAAHRLGFCQSSPLTSANQNDTFQPKTRASVAADLLHHWRATVAWVNANRKG